MELTLIIRQRLKNIKIVRICYKKINTIFRALLYDLSPLLLIRYRFLTMRGRWLNLNDPKTFDEKLIWLNLYWRHPLKTVCADKYNLRSYVKEKGLGHVLPKLYNVYDDVSEIDIDSLPNRFVLKCTNGWGMNIICRDKSNLNINKTKRILSRWMKVNPSKYCGEIHYSQIKPRIICEYYLDDLSGNLPLDYKIFCFAGKVRCTMACSSRNLNWRADFDFYDLEWKTKLPYSKSSLASNRRVEKPAAYEEMVTCAEILAQPFPFVRIDFYSIKGKAIIGEMTFTPNGCIDTGYTEDAQKILGELIHLPAKYISGNMIRG